MLKSIYVGVKGLLCFMSTIMCGIGFCFNDLLLFITSTLEIGVNSEATSLYKRKHGPFMQWEVGNYSPYSYTILKSGQRLPYKKTKFCKKLNRPFNNMHILTNHASQKKLTAQLNFSKAKQYFVPAFQQGLWD